MLGGRPAGAGYLARAAVVAAERVGEKRRELTITTGRRSNGFVEIGVVDAGSGFDEKERKKLFLPFNSTKAMGKGVGLFLRWSIVEAHGGDVWAEDGPVDGAVFRFTPPAG